MLKHLLFSTILALFTYMLFADLDRTPPSFPEGKIDCMGWTPYRHLHHEPKFNQQIPTESIHEDLKKISKVSSCVRTYFSTANISEAIKIGKKLNLRFMVGVYLSNNSIRNQLEIEAAIELANLHHEVIAIIVGNENISQKKFDTVDGLSPEKLYKYLKLVKHQVEVPVSTSELAYIWRSHPKLLKYVDFLGVNLLPYWHQIDANNTEKWIQQQLDALHAAFPSTSILITETGWPTRGANRTAAKASPNNQARYINSLLAVIKKNEKLLQNATGVRFSLFEAFDQPWKSSLFEGRIGAHWGIHNAFGGSKYKENKKKRLYQYFAISASVGGFLLSLLLALTHPRTYPTSIFLQALWVQIGTTACIYTIGVAYSDYLLMSFHVVWLLPFLFFPLGITHYFVLESCTALDISPCPKGLPIKCNSLVSVHIASSNENPDHVIACVESVLNQSYKHLEIILVDNNTMDENLWRPLAEKYENHSNVKFLHFEKLPGFKAGALNQALIATDKSAEYIAVLDSDYIVDTNWLAESLRNYSEDTVAVQYPQAYKSENCFFKSAMQNEYTGFFQSGMQVRNKKNAIILHGTMVMIQRDAVFAINWSEDCICEDARLGLEILKSGGELKYVHNEMGQGKLPTSYQAYLDQRFRWVYGGVRILIENAASLLSLKGELSLSQKYYYIWGWLPWMAELGFIIFWLPGICIALRMLEKAEDVPSGIYLTPLMVLLGMRLVATLFVYTKNQTCSLGEIFLAVIAGVSLTYTISLAALTALWCKNFPFIRTQKSDAAYTPHFSSRVKLSIYNLNRLHLDIVIALFFVLLSISISQSHGLSDTDRIAWVICFLSLSLPGICKALMLSMEHSKKA